MKHKTNKIETKKKGQVKTMGEFIKEEKFEYEYSAKKQAQVEAIRKKYVSQEEDKLETLKRLDQSVEKTGTAHALAVGIPGALIFGGGMSLVMTVGTTAALIGGTALGLVGAIPIGLAYPIYKKKVHDQRKKIAPQILALTEELSN